MKPFIKKTNVLLLAAASVFIISASNRPAVLQFSFTHGKKYEIYNYTRLVFSGIHQLFKTKKKNLLTITGVEGDKATCEIVSLLEINGDTERVPLKRRKQIFRVSRNGNIDEVISGKKLTYYKDVFPIIFPQGSVSSGSKWNTSIFHRWLKKEHEIKVVALYETTSEFRGRNIGVITFNGSIENLRYGNKTYRISASGKLYFDLAQDFVSFVFLKVSTYKAYKRGSYLLSSTLVKVVKIRRV